MVAPLFLKIVAFSIAKKVVVFLVAKVRLFSTYLELSVEPY